MLWVGKQDLELLATKFDNVNLYIRGLLQIKKELSIPQHCISYWVDPITDHKFRLRIWSSYLDDEEAQEFITALESRVARALSSKRVKWGFSNPKL